MIFGQNGKDVLNGDEGNDSIMGGNGKDEGHRWSGHRRAARRKWPPTSSRHGTAPPGDSIVGGFGEDTCLTEAEISPRGARNPGLSTETPFLAVE